MKHGIGQLLVVCLGLGGAAPALAQPTVLPSSLVRVRADNHFGVVENADINAPFGTAFSQAIVDDEMGTAATATNSAAYNFTLSAAESIFHIQTTQSHTIGSTGNLTEGFIQFTTTEPYVYEISGAFSGSSADPGDAYQNRPFLRQFQSPFATQYLEDETRTGTFAALYVNAGDDTGSQPGAYNQSGPRRGVLPPGTYEFTYELESNDRDVDQAAAATAAGFVRLVLRRPLPPTDLRAVTSPGGVGLLWRGSLDATSYVLEAGSAQGGSNLFNGDIGPLTSLTAGIPAGTYFVRLRSRNGSALGPATADTTFTVGSPACTTAPPAPSFHNVLLGGPYFELRWGSSAGATSYVIDAGTVPGGSDIGSLPMGGVQFFSATIPGGTYYTRVRATNGCGSSAPSAEVVLTPSCVGPPAPQSLQHTRNGGIVTLDWQASPGAGPYVLQVGTAPGASNIFAGSLGSATSISFPAAILPAGFYYMRVAGVGVCGQGPVSNEVILTLP